MKQCVNPYCESSFVYGDDKTICPFCHSQLEIIAVEESKDSNMNAGLILYEEEKDQLNVQNDGKLAFQQKSRFHKKIYHGRIIELDHHELFYDKKHKFWNAVLRAEPFQFAHQTIEYVVRVENITFDQSPSEVTDILLFGNYLGRLSVGDEIIVTAKECGDRRIAKKITNITTSSRVNPGLQIPACLIRGALVFLFLFIMMTLFSINKYFHNSDILEGVSTLKEGVISILIIVVGTWYLIKSELISHKSKKRRR